MMVNVEVWPNVVFWCPSWITRMLAALEIRGQEAEHTVKLRRVTVLARENRDARFWFACVSRM